MLFRIDDDILTIRFQGFEQFWAVKRKLVLSKTDIVRATWEEQVAIPRSELGWRFGGSNLPGVLVAGRFWGESGKNFVYLNKPSTDNGGMWQLPVNRNAVVSFQHVLELELRNQPYRRYLFTLDKPDIAESIVAWWRNNN